MAVLEQVSFGSLRQGAVPPGYTFTRSTAALYVDSDGLLKWSAHNLLLRSEEFDNAAWTKGAGASVSANTVTAPDGTLTGDSLVASGSPGSVYQTAVGLTPATIYTASTYVKYSNVQWVRFMYYDGGGNQCRVWVDVQNGVIGTGNTAGTGTFTAATIVPAGSGWYRISVTGTQPAVNGLVQLQPVTADASTTTAAGTVYLWGAQLNYGSTATAYLPTTSAARYDSPRRQWDATNRRWGYVGEGSRTNLCTYSAQLDNAAWTKTDCTITANSATSPDGTANADTLNSTVAGGRAIGFAVATATSSHAISVFVKAGTASSVTILLRNNTTATNLAEANFSLASGASSALTGAGAVAFEGENVGNGWWRIAVASSGGVTAGNSLALYVYPATSSGTGTSYAWGAQLEAGPAPSSYIPTTTIALSRGADLQARALTGPEGTALSTQGTMVVEFSNTQSDASGTVYAAASVSSSLSLEHAVYRYITSNGSRTLNAGLQYDQGATAAAGVAHKVAHAWIVDNCQGAIDGALLGNDAAPSSMPAVTTITIGGRFGGAAALYGLVYGWTIYDDAKTDAELQALSSQTKRGVGHWRTLDGTHRTAASPDKTVAIILEAECDLNTAGLDGIERVEFHYNVNGGSTTKVTKTARELLTYNCTDGSLNGLTKTWAYGFLLDCTVVAVGTIVVRATIFDNAGGVHQVPAEITVYNDTDGTDRRPSSAVVYYDHDAGDDTTGTGTTGNPFKTIRAAMNSLSGEVGGSTIRAKTRTVGCTASGSYSSSAIYTTGAWALTFEAVGSDKTIQRLTPGTFSDPQDYILGVDNTNVSRHLNLRFKDFEFVGPGPTVYANDRKVRVDEINCLYRSHAWTSSDTKPHVDYEEFGSGGIAFSTNTASVCRIYSWGGKWRGVGRGPQAYSGLFDFSVGPFLGVAIGTANNFGNDPCYTNGEVFGVRYIVGELDGLIQTNPNFTQLAGVHVTVSIQATGPHTGKMRIDATDSTPNDFGTAAQQLVGSTRWGVTVGSATTGANNGTFAALEGGLNGLGRPYCILNNASAVPEVGSAGFNMDTGALVGGARYIDAVHTDVLQIEADHKDAMFAHIRAWDCHNTRTWVGSGRTLRTCIFKNLSDGDSSGAFDFGSGSTTLLDCLFLSLSVASTAISFVGTFTGTNFVDCVWAAGTNIPTSGTFLHSNHYIVTSAGGTAPSTGVWFNRTPSNAPFDYSPSSGNLNTASGLQDMPPGWRFPTAAGDSRGAWKNVATGNWSTSLGSGGGSTAKIPYLGLGVRVGFL